VFDSVTVAPCVLMIASAGNNRFKSANDAVEMTPDPNNRVLWDKDIGRTYYRRFNHANRPSPEMMDAGMPL
jgi:hypothetical protein